VTHEKDGCAACQIEAARKLYDHDDRVCISSDDGKWRYIADVEQVSEDATPQLRVCRRGHGDETKLRDAPTPESPVDVPTPAGSMVLRFPDRGITWPVPYEVGQAINETVATEVSKVVAEVAGTIERQIRAIHVETSRSKKCKECGKDFPCRTLQALYPPNPQ
jgi:hypothetical protein